MKTKTKNENLLKISSMKMYSKGCYKFSIQYEEDNIIITVQNAQYFPIKTYELKTSLKEIQKMKYFDHFNYKNAEKFVNNVLKKSIDLDKFDIQYNQNDDSLLLEFTFEIFDNNYAEIKIPKKEVDCDSKSQIESFALIISDMEKKINKMEEDKKNADRKIKNDAAIKSFIGTSILKDEEKILISEWIDPKKIFKFNLLYSNSRDSDDSSTFHYYCDGVYPTVTVILDTSGRRFGGYSTHSWGQSSVGSNYARAVGSFIFSLSNKVKYDLSDPINYQAVYRHNSYGPWFGGGPDIRIASGCRSNSSSTCNRSSYNTGSYNILGGSGSTSFQVSYYEVYHVISE